MWDAGARGVLASSAFLGDCGTCWLVMQSGVANIARFGYSGECYKVLYDRNTQAYYAICYSSSLHYDGTYKSNLDQARCSKIYDTVRLLMP